jgi:hypothetical protein
MAVQFAYSLNGEDYCGAFASREAALETAFAAARRVAEPPLSVFVGRTVATAPKSDGHARGVLSEMAAAARQEVGDANLRYLANLTSEQVEDLDCKLAGTIRVWLNTNLLAPTFYRVQSISEHAVPSEPENHLYAETPSEVHEIGVGQAVALGEFEESMSGR